MGSSSHLRCSMLVTQSAMNNLYHDDNEDDRESSGSSSQEEGNLSQDEEEDVTNCSLHGINPHNINKTTHSTLPDAERMIACQHCRKNILPFKRSRGISQNALWEKVALAGWDCEDGFLDILRLVNEECESNIRIPKDLTKRIVESTKRHLRELKTKLMEAGLQRHSDQNFAAESVHAARIVAPFHSSEVQVGRLLGTGGFSSVSAVNAFHLQSKPSRIRRTLSRNEELSRKYLADHATLPITHQKNSTNTSAHTIATTCSTHAFDPGALPPDDFTRFDDVFTRYAIKRLKPSLLEQSYDKFHHAAVDLVLEGQLLMVLDHPNIISIRGLSVDGPNAFQEGSVSDYFLILDRLPQTFEDKIHFWRSQITKYRKCWRRRLATKQLQRRMSSWFRLNRKHNAKTPIAQVQTDPKLHKCAVKLQKILLEQLKASHGLASAVQYLHSKRIIHRDIKGSNIGFDSHGETKIFDLGLARLLPRLVCPEEDEDSGGSNYEVFRMSRVGTKFYMSPEVLRKDPYGTPSDVYSVGVVLWEIFSLSTPRDIYHMRREAYEEAEHKKRTPEYDFPKLRRELKEGIAGMWLPICSCWPEAIKTLIEGCLSPSAKERPTMQHVCSVLEGEIERISATLQQQSVYVPRRRSTFRLDLSNLQVAIGEEASKDGDDDDVCCGTSTTTNLTALPVEGIPGVGAGAGGAASVLAQR